jgi:2-amino-4-hydroxy-6-hydroxymethyldihydropteridine diphosphokinase
MNKIYLALGSNIGRRRNNLIKALKLIEECGIKITKKSKIYETKAVSQVKQGDFLNMCVEAKTRHSPEKVLRAIKVVEKQMGRKRKEKKRSGYEKPRIIDIDILLFGGNIISKRNIKIPHPSMHKRKFVLKPLNDIAPDALHPIIKKKISELLKNPHN